jgi:hypothetical protein
VGRIGGVEFSRGRDEFLEGWDIWSGQIPGGLGQMVGQIGGTNFWRVGTFGRGNFLGGELFSGKNWRDKVPGQIIILGAFASKTLLK